MTRRHSVALALTLALAALLAACGGQAALPPTSAPTEAAAAPTEAASPTFVPSPTPAPDATPAATAEPETTAIPTAAPVAGGVLPRALYTLQAGQIFRLEPDGATSAQITDETPFRPDAVAITEFAVSPADGALAYVVQREGAPLLVRAGPDGQDPAPLFEREGVGVSDPVFSPDGQLVAVRLAGPAEQPEAFQSGIYLIPAAGGEPRLLVADEASADPNALSYGHAPSAFAPDGARLLTSRFATMVELCDLAVVAVPDGAAVPVQVPAPAEGERQTTCDAGVWAPDGSALYFTAVRIGAPAGEPAIYRADPATGASFPITPQPEAPPLTLYAFPSVAADGSLRAFVAEADALPAAFDPAVAPLAYTMSRVDPADGMAAPLGATLAETPGHVLWAPDGSGAVALLFPQVGDPGLFWLPADGGEPTLLLGATTNLFSYQWAAR